MLPVVMQHDATLHNKIRSGTGILNEPYQNSSTCCDAMW